MPASLTAVIHFWLINARVSQSILFKIRLIQYIQVIRIHAKETQSEAG